MSRQHRPSRFSVLLRNIYEDPRAPASFGSPYRLYQAAKLRDHRIRLKDVDYWLSTRKAYTLHRDIKLRFPRRMVLTRGIDYLWQLDLVDYQVLWRENSGYQYLLTVIDCFSRYAVAVPMKDKTMESSTKAFIKVMAAVKSKPKKVQTDRGKEFTGETFKNMLKAHKIHLYHTNTIVKCALVERFNRTLRSRIQKYMVTKNTLRYVDVLPDLVLGYNRTKHSALEKYSPEQVNKKNEKEVFNILYGEYLAKRKKTHKLKIGDTVRITEFRSKFKKGHQRNFTKDKYIVVDTFFTTPPTYAVKPVVKRKGKLQVQFPIYEEEIQIVRDE